MSKMSSHVTPFSKDIQIKTLVSVVGVSRSGIHALCEWILDQFEEPTLYLQNQRPFSRFVHRNHNSMPDSNVCLINIIDEDMNRCNKFPEYCNQLSTEQCHHILILRDPFNWLASYMHHGRIKHKKKAFFYGKMLLWKESAKSFLEENEYIKVRYDDWFLSAAYRKKLSSTLGGTFSDDKINHVPPDAKGSSFDGLDFDGRAQDMKVFDRWKHCANDKTYRSLLDAEVFDLAQEIFGSEIVKQLEI